MKEGGLQYSHCGDVLSWKGIGGVADEQAGLTHSSGEGREMRNCYQLMFVSFSSMQYAYVETFPDFQIIVCVSKQWSKIQRNQFLNYIFKKNLYLSFPNSFKNGFSSTPNTDTVATGDQRRLGLFPLLFETCEFPVNETHQM